MKRKWIKAAGMLMAAATVLTLVSCVKQNKDDEAETTTEALETTPAVTSGGVVRTGSEGLSFTVSGDGESTLTGLGSCTDTAVSIPAVDDDGNRVTAIAAGAFKSTRVSAIEIPETVSKIADGAFAGCTKLSYISVSLRNEDFRSVDGVLYDAGMKTLICYPGARADQTLSIPSSVTVKVRPLPSLVPMRRVLAVVVTTKPFRHRVRSPVRVTSPVMVTLPVR